MLIEEQNEKGGLLGKKLEAVVGDPASHWPLFAEKTREPLEKDKVASVIGRWAPVSRKSVPLAFEEFDGLFCPVRYECELSSKIVFYADAAPNQRGDPRGRSPIKEEGVERWSPAGRDFVHPRTTNKPSRSIGANNPMKAQS